MGIVRLGTIGYLNARPLAHGLDRRPDLFSLRSDVPSRCAALLHEGAIDLGLIPSIEYVHRADYRIVPNVAIVSRGPVASVALFTSRPTAAIRSIAVDSSSRTAAALVRVLCAQAFNIEPAFVTLPPDLPAMLQRCDAALLIGDVALFADHGAAGVGKIDLGEQWTALTGLPFVWALWAGRANAIGSEHVAALQGARDAGVRALDEIASACFPGDPERVAIGRAYLRQNVDYEFDEQARAGLLKFYDVACGLGLVPAAGTVRFL